MWHYLLHIRHIISLTGPLWDLDDACTLHWTGLSSILVIIGRLFYKKALFSVCLWVENCCLNTVRIFNDNFTTIYIALKTNVYQIESNVRIYIFSHIWSVLCEIVIQLPISCLDIKIIVYSTYYLILLRIFNLFQERSLFNLSTFSFDTKFQCQKLWSNCESILIHF